MKKQSSNWYIAATHYLTAGFVAPLLLGFLASFLTSIMPLFTAGIGKVLFGFIFLVLAIWLGTMYSARYLKKTYVITSESKQRIANLATIYFVVLRLIFYMYGFLWAITKIRISGGMITDFLLNILIFVAMGGALFYYLSRKYITEDSAITNQ
ncbi:MAG: hypothetical protein A2896_03105 [Candidatus Nealsonbacteria bacterium RIFCSPLOWO2_01_FULL_43_32]|uniref:Uncharacterized protein n=1 Tax=Candidatus Nealsonbacteria bacterium RIFCSPLOWO2_01_FULL_43_32 TaxID=1801672 RepID=A0A1G2EDK4_9BACT|nr:MAG: hypothetical protein A2896_03105 [Candidatus Nealsonbacteria bacterium RIFCSPLOWO2_01_FULL_43_32]